MSSTFGQSITALIDRHAPTENRDAWAIGSAQMRIAVDVFSVVDDACLDYNEHPLTGLTWGTFDNCREWGLTVSAGGWTFCAYEHRNSDQIHVEGCPNSEVQEWGPYGGEGKWDTLGCLGPNDAYSMGEAVVDAIRHVIANPAATRESVKRAMRGVMA